MAEGKGVKLNFVKWKEKGPQIIANFIIILCCIPEKLFELNAP